MVAFRDVIDRLLSRTGGEQAVPAADTGGLFPPDPERPVVLVSLLGLGAEAIEAEVERVMAAEPAGSRIVCLTDHPDFMVFRRLRLAFEYLPGHAPHLADVRLWQDYIRARYDILLAKWRPQRTIEAGRGLTYFLSAPEGGLDGSIPSSSAERSVPTSAP